MIKVGDQILGGLDTAGEANEIGRDACGGELGVVHLAVSGVGRVQAAGAGIGDVGLDGGNAELLHHALGGGATALHGEADDTAGAIRHIGFCQFILAVTRQAGEVYPANFWMFFQKFCHLLRILTMALHSQVQGFKT